MRTTTSRLGPIIRGIFAAVLTAAVLVLYIHVRFGLNAPPSATGDEPSYDSIGWQLATGQGYSEDFTEPAFRAPYDALVTSEPERMSLPETTPGLVTYRPPLFPTVIAALNSLCGRQFYATRIFNIAMVSTTAGILVTFVERRAGTVVAAIALLTFLAADLRPRLFARAILTESPAMCLGAILALALCHLVSQGRLRSAVLAGCCGGLAGLNRNATAVALPIVAAGLMIWLAVRRRHARHARSAASKPVLASVLFLGVAAAALSPWAVRNIRVLQSFMPLGAQGMMELPAGFSDQAWARRGVWAPVVGSTLNERDTEVRSRPELERARAEEGQRAALAWIVRHPAKVAALGVLKVRNEYQPRGVVQWILATTALLGLYQTRHRTCTQVFLLLHAANMMVIACTWSVEGRFVVPLLFTIHVWSALGIATVVGHLRGPESVDRNAKLQPGPESESAGCLDAREA